jgi:hypothetical protein
MACCFVDWSPNNGNATALSGVKRKNRMARVAVINRSGVRKFMGSSSAWKITEATPLTQHLRIAMAIQFMAAPLFVSLFSPAK